MDEQGRNIMCVRTLPSVTVYYLCNIREYVTTKKQIEIGIM